MAAALENRDRRISRHDSGELEAEKGGRKLRRRSKASVATIQESLRRNGLRAEHLEPMGISRHDSGELEAGDAERR